MLAQRSGLSLRFLSDVEAGRGNLSVLRLAALCGALETTPAEALARAETRREPWVALLGLRGAGKTTLGVRLAALRRARFVELNACIAELAGVPLPEVFELHGEAAYRRLECSALRQLFADGKGGVIATGGGIVGNPEALSLLKARTVTVWLRASPEEHMERVLGQGDTRPMANRSNAMEELRALWKARAGLYGEAEHVLDTSGLGADAAFARLAALLGDTADAR